MTVSAAQAEELRERFLPDLKGKARTSAQGLLGRLIEDWQREAEGTTDPAAVRGFQEQALTRALGSTADAERLRALHLVLLQRRADHLGGQTLALGKSILGGETNESKGRTQGKRLLAEIEKLAAEAKSLEPLPGPLKVELGEALMEALFAIERKAMSLRLQRET